MRYGTNRLYNVVLCGHHHGMCGRSVFVLLMFIGLPGFGATPDFARDVRPVLSNHCFQCHGPDDDSREAGLRLDTQEGVESVLNRKDLRLSSLIERIHADDEDIVMPPTESNKPLSREQKELLRDWVISGGEWTQHWAFIPPERKSPPGTSDWGRNEIDAFALQRMEAVGLKPAPEADPYTLIRRLYLDLIGLPPTPAQADQWKARIWSDADDAGRSGAIDETQWQALVTELLGASAWGERWARRWLDLARYADTNGYEKDRDRSIWPYRDWVINALNSGMPFDQFTIEQIAGDMLPDATQSQHVATGFHRNTMLNEEGGIDPLEFRFHAMTDRVATTGTTWLGLTLGCAQCHTHKYDPISHREYYGLMAFLNNADEPTLTLIDEATAEKNLERQDRAQALIRGLPNKWPGDAAQSEAGRQKDLDAAFDAWLEQESANAVEWRNMIPVETRSSLPSLAIEDDAVIFASGDTAKRDDYWITLAAPDEPVTAIQLEVLPDDRLPGGGPGTTYYEGTIGDFFLNEITVSANGMPHTITRATESWAKDRFGRDSGASLTIDGDVQTGWSVHERIGERHVAVFQLEKPVPASVPVEVHMTFGRHFASSLGRFRFLATSTDRRPTARDHTRRIAELLAKDAESRSADETAELLTAFLMQAPQLKEHSDEIRKLLKPVDVSETLVMQERPAGQTRVTHRHHRGEYLQAEEVVAPMTPAVLHPLPDDAPADRLALARWLVSPKNPLTARVVVNRHWAAIFGTGIVRTLDDFGLQGEFPTHPDLLDWLAVTFVEDDDWSLRELHRRIVSSALYRQSAVATPTARRIDPDNRLLSHSPRYRMDAEIIRDRLLVASGVYHEQVGGPSVFPPQPAGVQDAAYRKGEWKESEGPQRYRRSLYTFSRRTSPFAMLSTFDGPSGESCIARRNRSNNPLQALTLLNDTMFTELARKAALASRSKDATYETTLRDLFRRVLTRPPTPDEVSSLRAFAEQLRSSFSSDPARANKVTGEDASADIDVVESAVWVGVARALFALDETVMRE